ncbi:sigma-70 family RNA polymerase sigma factor [Nocardioides fonticola]|uniref:Sigma-70 family RNA polymerase sigma factor n=1 Tax=Nocardioides fonticola TaxID=450363 RepID=A0ABP7XI38_9ACTN
MSATQVGVDADARTDTALVRAARLGDQEAFRVIVERHGPAMYRYALRMVGSGAESDAAEVTQEALVSAWKDIGSFQGRSELRTWLIRLVHRRAVDLARRRRPVPIDDQVMAAIARPAPDDPLQSVLDAELLAALQAALDTLPPLQRAAWLLREVEQMSYEEIATALGVPLDSARGHLQRGRRTLAERMARWR